MATTKMGFEGEIYFGAAGSTASTKLTNTRDITVNMETEDGDTTTRGAGTAPPIGTMRVTRRNFTITWTMLMKTTDTSLEALRVAAMAGTAVAIRTKDYAAGKGFDGDVHLKVNHGKPLGGEQTFEFTAIPTDAEGRDPQPYV